MRKQVILLLIAVCCLSGCVTQQSLPENVTVVRSGIFATNDITSIPFPTSGYDIYLVGESHGMHEIEMLFCDYLKDLNECTGLRDIALEEDNLYERKANQYINGDSDTLPAGLCLRTNILEGVRNINSALPDDKKIRVHLVDVDCTPEAIHEHLLLLQKEIGSSAEHIDIPSLSEFYWLEKDTMVDLVTQMKKTTEDDSLLHELETITSSMHFHKTGSDFGIGRGYIDPDGFPIREEQITKNIQYVQEKTGGPILALFGSAHGMKVNASLGSQAPPDMKPLAQQLIEGGAKVYSACVFPMSGEKYWRGSGASFQGDPTKIQFADGSTLESIMEAAPESNIIVIDLRVKRNANTLIKYFKEIPAGQIYDSFIVFREVTPMEDKCP